MNLLDDPLIGTEGAGHQTLPGVMAAMARDELHGFPALRPHQRPAWHMFLVQLAVLALRGQGGELPVATDDWRAGLLRLSGGDAGAWALIGPPEWPAFMQPAVPSGVAYEAKNLVPTPDALDMLITSKNHDLKSRVAIAAAPEDWIFALVSLQTMEGYSGGQGRLNGIARMNGGSSSRVLMGLAPAGQGAPDPSAWWRRDVGVLRRRGVQGLGPEGGAALLWTLPWPEGAQLALTELDPLFVEVCRRVRLEARDGRIVALHRGSAKARTDASGMKGVTGDPWCPVHLAEAKAMTLADQRFSYRLLSRLIWGEGDGKLWELPLLAKPEAGETGMVLIAEAFARGNCRTDGFMSRVVPVPAGEGWLGPQTGKIAEAQIGEIGVLDQALRNGLAVYAAGGRREAVKKDHYNLTREARGRLDAFADAIFFEHLWRRAERPDDERRGEFLRALLAAAEAELDCGMAAIPVPGIWAPRARVAAQAAFRGTLRRNASIAALIFREGAKNDDDNAAA